MYNTMGRLEIPKERPAQWSVSMKGATPPLSTRMTSLPTGKSRAPKSSDSLGSSYGVPPLILVPNDLGWFAMDGDPRTLKSSGNAIYLHGDIPPVLPKTLSPWVLMGSSRLGDDTPQPAGCPPVPPPSESEKAGAAADLMKATGAQACSTHQMSATAKATVSALFASAALSLTASESSTLGCEQIIAIAEKYRAVQQNVTCILNQSTTTIKKVLTNVNSIRFEAGGDLNIMCPDLKIGQGISIKTVDEINISDQDETQIADDISSVAKAVANTIQTNVAGFGSTEKGGKEVIDRLTQVDNIDYKAKVKQAFREFSTTMDNQNNLVFKAGGNINIMAKEQCQITQDIVLDLASKYVIDSVLKDAFSTSISSVNDFENQIQQSSQGKGAESLDEGFWNNYFNSSMMMYIIGGIILFVLLFVGYKLFMSPAGQKAVTNASEAYKAGKSYCSLH
jgi:hypothetical protein